MIAPATSTTGDEKANATTCDGHARERSINKDSHTCAMYSCAHAYICTYDIPYGFICDDALLPALTALTSSHVTTAASRAARAKAAPKKHGSPLRRQTRSPEHTEDPPQNPVFVRVHI